MYFVIFYSASMYVYRVLLCFRCHRVSTSADVDAQMRRKCLLCKNGHRARFLALLKASSVLAMEVEYGIAAAGAVMNGRNSRNASCMRKVANRQLIVARTFDAAPLCSMHRALGNTAYQ